MEDVLIINDEVDSCLFLADILKKLGLKANAVNSLADAKEIMSIKSYSLVFLDNTLRDGSGLDFISNIKAQAYDSTIIMLTANLIDQQKALQSGVDLCIDKPFNQHSIVHALWNVPEKI